MDPAGDESHLAALIPDGPEPVEHRRIIAPGIFSAVGEIALAGDDIFDPVAVDVGEGDAVELAEYDAPGGIGWIPPHDEMSLEGDLAIRAGLLLEPDEAVGVRVQRGEDILVAIAVEIVGEHLGTSLGRGERESVSRPRAVGPRLFPPGRFFQEVGAAVAVDVAEPEPVGEFPPGRIGRGDWGELPRLVRVRPIGRRDESEPPSEGAEDFGFAIAGHIRPDRGFVLDPIEHIKPLPRLACVSGTRVLQPVGAIPASGEPHHQDIVPAIAIEVVDVAEEVVRVSPDRERDRFVEQVPLRKIGAGKPERTVGDVRFAVVVQVPQSRSFGVELVAQLEGFKSGPASGIGDRRAAGEQGEW